MMEKISADLKDAMKKREKVRLNALRYIKKLLIENKTAKKPLNELDVIVKYGKQLKDSLVNFPEDSEQFKNVKEEIEVVAVYLPEQLSEDAVKKQINDIVAGLDNAQMGFVMKELNSQIKGRFDGKRASELVKEALAKGE